MLSRTTRVVLRQAVFPLRRLNSQSRYKSIDEFNKSKKDFQFAPEVDNFTYGDKNHPLNADFQELPALENHPSLKVLKPNSPDYKHQLAILQQEFQKKKEQERAKWELMERFKGLGAGLAALVGIITTYQLVMNYKYLKAYLRNLWQHDIDVSSVRDMNDPKTNQKTVASLVERLNAEMDDEFIAGLKDSKTVPGLYLFGAVSGKKLPQRLKGFDGMFLEDVLLKDDYVVAVDDKGRVYHYNKKFDAPVQVSIPGKISQVVASNNRFFYVSKNGKDLFYGDRIDPQSEEKKGWFSSGVVYDVGKVTLDSLNRNEKLTTVAPGYEHLLLLTSQGRILAVNTSDEPVNKGQYGLPKYSSFGGSEPVPKNVAFDLTNINNEVVLLDGGVKGIKPRTFSAIAATNYANVAVESNGNLWTWGDNSSCQCGRPITVSEDSQPVPKMVYSLADLARISKYSLEDVGKNGTFSVDAVSSANNTFYLKMSYHNEESDSAKQDLLLAFGDGLRGQLGISRYVHMAHTPLVIKSLVGMKEYNETKQSTENIGVKSIIGGGDHVFVTLDNAGGQKEVLVFGDNSKGQFGNGRTVKSAKPIQLPKLIEPEDIDASARVLAKKVNDQTKNRLQLTDGEIEGVEQVLAAGEQSSAIYYRRK